MGSSGEKSSSSFLPRLEADTGLAGPWSNERKNAGVRRCQLARTRQSKARQLTSYLNHKLDLLDDEALIVTITLLYLKFFITKLP